MPAKDYLKSFRENDYGSPQKREGEKTEDNGHSRIISLTDDEKKYFGEMGSDVACEVHGKIEEDGLHVMTVSPMGTGNSEGQMADQVMNRVMPNVVPSPS